MKDLYLGLISLLALGMLLVSGCSGSSEQPEEPGEEPVRETLFLDISSPFDEATVTEPAVMVTGKTLPDAVVSINGEVVTIEVGGQFTAETALEVGPNVIEIVASDFYGGETSKILTVFYIP
jgi:hypothetical protein